MTTNFTCEQIARAVLGEPLKREGGEFLWRCPRPERHAHGDAHPSLKINTAKNTWACFVCGVSGTAWQLAAFIANLDPGDKQRVTEYLRKISKQDDEKPSARSAPRVVAEYKYTDAQGELLYVVERRDPKDFRQRRPDGRGGWLWNLNGTRRVLYNLPEVIAACDVVIVEGERDVETARSLGLVAACNPCGANQWRDEYSEPLRGKRVVVIADADGPGRNHANQVAVSLVGKVESLKVTELPGAKDLTEWIERGGRREALLGWFDECVPQWAQPKTENAGGFTLTSLGELLSRPDLPIDYVLEDRLVAGTVSVVVAKPKVGKSTLARNLCLAVSRGEDFCGLKTKSGECIYLALEEREEDVRADFRAMGADGTESILVHAAMAPVEGIFALCDLIRQRRPVLVAVDPLFRLARIRDEKAYAETYAALGPLIDVARVAGTHVLLTHHAGKSMKADAIDSPLGSTAIGGAVSTVFVLKRTETYRTIQSVQRVGPDMPETVLEFDADSRRVSLGGSRLEVDRRECEDAISVFLGDADGPQTQQQIREGVGGKTRVIRAALTALAESGRITKTGSGTKGKPFLYEFPNSGSQHIAGTREPESKNGSNGT